VTGLRDRLQAELGNWRERLPIGWRDEFGDIALNFDAVDQQSELAPDEAIWPQEHSVNKTARLFKALDDLRPREVRVVIFGNDPYTKITQATGRSFEQGDVTDWARDIRMRGRISPSMQSIVAAAAATDRKTARYSLCDARMVYDEPDAKKAPKDTATASRAQPLWFSHVELARAFADGAIELPEPRKIFKHWASQGVLWLNRSLTYTKWDDVHRESHRQLWAPFTNRMLQILVAQGVHHPIVFALWGDPAQKLAPQIRQRAKKAKINESAIRFCLSGHPQWPANYFPQGNPLAAINQAIGKAGKSITWT
jgi:uracil-DNA glycosylase